MARIAKLEKKARRRRATPAPPAVSNVVPLFPRRPLATAGPAAAPAGDGCPKCGSRFLVFEPLFVHCRYCGSLHRRPAGSLLEQEDFELRSGLRAAS